MSDGELVPNHTVKRLCNEQRDKYRGSAGLFMAIRELIYSMNGSCRMEDMALCVIRLVQLLKIFDVHVPELQHSLQFMRSVGVGGDAHVCV